MQDGASFQISWIQAFLVLVSLACCMGCLWLVFVFGRRIQTSAYLRDSLVAATKAEELRNLIRDLEAKRTIGPLDPSKPPPSGFDADLRLFWANSNERARLSTNGFGPVPVSIGTLGHSQEEIDKFVKEERIRDEREKEKRRPFEEWGKEERERYNELVIKAEAQAQRNAEARVPTSMDISMLGGGWSFLLEFSTVIVIIFILLCLGILNSITGKDLTTILASIAGYVLGKASTATAGNRGQSTEVVPAAKPS